MNQELEQYLRFFVDYRQKDWLEWLVLAEFAVNNKVHSKTKMSPFMKNYSRKLKIEVDIRRKGKMEKATEFAERIKKIQKEAGVALKKAQEEMKQQVDKERRETEIWKIGDKVILSMRDLVFRERLARKLID